MSVALIRDQPLPVYFLVDGSASVSVVVQRQRKVTKHYGPLSDALVGTEETSAPRLCSEMLA
jgi:hypothetical protein